MVASKCWPHGKDRPSFTLENVKLSIFGEEGGVSFPRFGITLVAGETAEGFVAAVEREARDIVDDITDRKYLARRAAAGTMPHLNRVFEELGEHHKECSFLAKVLKSLTENARKAAAKNTTAAEESKKRKGLGRGKVTSKRQRAITASAVAFAGSHGDVEGSEVEAIPSMAEMVGDMEASVPRADANLMATSARLPGGGLAPEAPKDEPLPTTFGHASMSSSSKVKTLARAQQPMTRLCPRGG